jgi:hypothetical protein
MKRTSTSLVLSGLDFDLPTRVEVPAEHDPVRRFVGQHARPAALAAIHRPVVNMAAYPGFEDRLGQLHPEDVVLGRLEVTKSLGEHRERVLDRCLHDDLRSHHCLSCLRTHHRSWSNCSADRL